LIGSTAAAAVVGFNVTPAVAASGSSAADFERFVAQDVLRWRDVVRYAGAKPE